MKELNCKKLFISKQKWIFSLLVVWHRFLNACNKFNYCKNLTWISDTDWLKVEKKRRSDMFFCQLDFKTAITLSVL